MSWVFLTDRHAFKLKKPVRYEFLDYSTLEARQRACEDEIRLNRRLADNVYMGVVPLLVTGGGELRLGGDGEVVDWLVKMRRLPEKLMLDEAIAARTATQANARAVGEVLGVFYRAAQKVGITGAEYRARLRAEIRSSGRELVRPEYRLPAGMVEAVVAGQLQTLAREPALFDARVEAGMIVEGHGDLRPEHVCLEQPPVIIDCLEFNRSLRIVDVASELSFLWLECERLGSPGIGRTIFETCCDVTGDRPPPRVIDFYRDWHACVRAKVAVWHLRDHEINHPEKWMEKARHYIHHAAAKHQMS